MTWWPLGEGHGVLELDAPALELHWLSIGGRTLAWWVDEHGRWLASAQVGEC
jgi:hypothetical protein